MWLTVHVECCKVVPTVEYWWWWWSYLHLQLEMLDWMTVSDQYRWHCFWMEVHVDSVTDGEESVYILA